MKKPFGELGYAHQNFELPPTETLRPKLDELDALPSVRNRFLPSLLRLAGKETSGAELTVELLKAIDDFARSRAQPLRGQTVKRMIGELPDYLRLLISDESVLEDTLALMEQVLAQPEILAMLEPEHTTNGPEEETIPFVRGAPRGVKRLLAIPEDERTPAQNRSLQKWLGKQGLKGARHVSLSQRELAQRQAEREQRRER